MKYLVLIRHSKSSWENSLLSDHARPLAPRGLRDAPMMGARLKKRRVFPDLIISSDAERTKQTAHLIVQGLGIELMKITFKRNLYHAEAHEILSVVRSTPNEIDTLFLIGHNPGMNDLMWKMKGTLENLPTTGVFAVKASIIDWKDFKAENSDFWFEDYPKKALNK